MAESVDALFARVEADRAAWRWWKRSWMWLRWNVFQPIDRLPGRLRNAYQRSRRGFGYQDAWGFDTYAARVNADFCAHLREIAHGCPVGLGMDSVTDWDDSLETRATIYAQVDRIDSLIGYNGNREEGFPRWMAMLTYFEEGWRSYSRYMEGGYDVADQERWEAMMPLWAEWYGGLWD